MQLFKFKQILQICVIYVFPCEYRRRALSLLKTNGNSAKLSN